MRACRLLVAIVTTVFAGRAFPDALASASFTVSARVVRSISAQVRVADPSEAGAPSPRLDAHVAGGVEGVQPGVITESALTDGGLVVTIYPDGEPPGVAFRTSPSR